MKQRYFFVSFDYVYIDYENYDNYDKISRLYKKYNIDGLYFFKNEETNELVDIFTTRKFQPQEIYFYDKYRNEDIVKKCFYNLNSSMYVEQKGLKELDVKTFSKMLSKHTCKNYDDFYEELDKINEEDINYKSKMNLVLLKNGIEYTR